MKKKILSAFLITSIAVTGLFASYSSPSIILDGEIAAQDYNFKLQRIINSVSYEDYTDDYEETITLNSTGGTTKPFAIATTDYGNMGSPITFKTTVTTGEFVTEGDEPIHSGWWPTIIEKTSDSTTENDNTAFDDFAETVNYLADSFNGNYSETSIGKFSTTFEAGIHSTGTEIARFSLSYKGDDNLIAGTYKSTTTIEITT